jgi:nicotinamidase/pyrazinamidase
MAKRKVHLVIIDPQVSFCDTAGELYVKGADEDMTRVAAHIDKAGEEITEISVTQDSHYWIDCSHPGYWINDKGEHPPAFTPTQVGTVLSSDLVKNGVWKPIYPNETQRMIDYEEALEATQKYPHCIWNPHCLIGTDGHKIYPVLWEALMRWQVAKRQNINVVTKGSNRFTEHYSAIKAEVPDPKDPTTQIDTKFIQGLREVDEIRFCGEAGSHCGRFTGEDICTEFGDDSYAAKFCLLTDGMSPVPTFEQGQQDFIDGMTAKGARVALTTDF